MREAHDGSADEEPREVSPEYARPLAAELPGLPLAPMASETLVADRSAGESVRHLTATALTKCSASDYVAAVDLLVRALKLVPNSAAAHNNLALALWRSKRGVRGEALARRAIRL